MIFVEMMMYKNSKSKGQWEGLKREMRMAIVKVGRDECRDRLKRVGRNTK